jgi:hypothetical protein
MIDDFIVLDNVISKNYQEAIFNRLLDDRNFPWFYIPNISKKSTGEDIKETDSFGFAHAFLGPDGPIGRMTDFLLPLSYEACQKIDFNPMRYFYGRIFMTVAMENSPKFNQMHVDMPIPHLVCLYYVNDSDGPTVISSITSDDMSNDEINALDDKKIFKEIEPKQGRCVLFNGKHYHASSNPSQGRRIIINFNIG